MSKKETLKKTIALFLGLFLFYIILSQAVARIPLSASWNKTLDLIVKGIVSIGSIMAVILFLGIDLAQTTAQTFLKATFLVGGFFWLFIGLNFFLSKNEVDQTAFSIENIGMLVFYFVYALLVGLVEEALCRGVLLTGLCLAFKNRRYGYQEALAISSGIFSSWHLVNLLARPSLIWATLAQIVFAFAAGLYFGAVFLRTKNLWATAFLHAMFDFGVYAWLPFSSKARESLEEDSSYMKVLLYVFLALLLAGAALILIRKTKRQEMDDLWKET